MFPDRAGSNRVGPRQRRCLLLADTVEKRFCSSEHARLIQDQAPMRNVDSKIHSPRFDCCVSLFHSFFAVTFSTASAPKSRADYGPGGQESGVLLTRIARFEPFAC